MTRAEIMELSGLELRKAVAKAKGWYVYHYDKGSNDYYMLLDEDANPVNPVYPNNARISEDECWEYDCPCWESNIRDAWSLVEELEDQDIQLVIYSLVNFVTVYALKTVLKARVGCVLLVNLAQPGAIRVLRLFAVPIYW